MSKITTFKWGAMAALAVTTLAGCVDIKSDAKVESDAKVSFSTTYDLSRVLPVLQNMSKNSEDIAKNFSCDKMNEKLAESKSLKCKDISAGKFEVSGEFKGDATHGVIINKDKNEMSVDAVALFRTIADLNPAKKDNAQPADKAANNDPDTPPTGADAATALMDKGLVPVATDQVDMYKKIGMVLSINVTLPNDVLTVDGVASKDVKLVNEKTVSVNFVDIAGKNNYIITSKLSQNRIVWKILFIVLMIALIAAAVWYLLKKDKSSKSPQPPTPAASPVAAESATDVGAASMVSMTAPASTAVNEVVESTQEALETAQEKVEELKNDGVDAFDQGAAKVDAVIDEATDVDGKPSAPTEPPKASN